MSGRRLLGGYAGLFIGLTIAGLVCIGWGASLPDGVVSDILIGLGGAVLGTSTAGLLSTLSQADFLAEAHGVLANSLAPGIVSEEAAIADFRQTFHWYTVSAMDGERHWRHAVIDFSNSRSAGRLTAAIPAVNRAGETQFYSCHAGFVDERFVHVNKAIRGRESASVYVYPSLGKDFYEVHCGFGLKESWDGSSLVVPAILSSRPVLHEVAVGRVQDRDVEAQLERAWRDGTKGMFALGSVIDPPNAVTDGLRAVEPRATPPQ